MVRVSEAHVIVGVMLKESFLKEVMCEQSRVVFSQKKKKGRVQRPTHSIFSHNSRASFMASLRLRV